MRIREATPQDLPEMARVNVDTRRSCYSSFYPNELLDRMSYEQVESAWRQVLWGNIGSQSNFAYVAEETTGKIVGILIAGPEQTGDETFQDEIARLEKQPAPSTWTPR